MSEADLTKRAVAALRAGLPGAVVFKHWDHLTVMPDVSVTWNGRTSWLEFKLVPGLRSGIAAQGAQTLMMKRLHDAGWAVYVIFVAKPAQIVIIPPSHVGEWALSGLVADGHNPGFIVEYVRRAHTGTMPDFVREHARTR